MSNFIKLAERLKALPPLVPVSKWADVVGDRSVASLRWDIFINRNGFADRCIVRRGNRLLVDVRAYFEFLFEHQGNAQGGKS